MSLSKEQIENLKKQGFSEEEINQAMRELEKEELEKSAGISQQQRDSDPRKFAQHSSFATKPTDDLIKLQLEMNDILERSEHILRGDVVTFKNGQLIWDRNPTPHENTLNECGVQLIMKIISSYINRNTILADYDEEEVRLKVYDFGRELNNLIFMKYEEMGMDDESKRKEYPMLVRQIVDIVHSAYARAKDGGERRSMREIISVQQSHSSMAQGGITVNATGQPTKSRGILNPMRYLSGKYV
jgi:hypothetical protein